MKLLQILKARLGRIPIAQCPGNFVHQKFHMRKVKMKHIQQPMFCAFDILAAGMFVEP